MSAGMTDCDHFEGVQLPRISDEVMREWLPEANTYTAAVLHKTAKFVRPEADPIVWEHGRRNFALREHGVLAIVMPVGDDPSGWAGIGIFAATAAQVAEILDHDPGVQAEIFSYELHPVRGFPGSCLPA